MYGPNKDRKNDHYLVVRETYPLKKDYKEREEDDKKFHITKSPESFRGQTRDVIFQDLEDRWIHNIDDNVRRMLCIGSMLDPRFKTTQDTVPEFTDHMIDIHSVFEFELLSRWVPKDPEAVCCVVNYSSTTTPTDISLIPPTSRLSGSICMSNFLT